MNPPLTTLKIALLGRCVCVKISGRANFVSSVDLKRVANELWERGYHRFVFDVTECQTMDSTFLGVLSGIGLRVREEPAADAAPLPELLNPIPRLLDLVENLGVAELFKVVQAEAPVDGNFEALEHKDASHGETTRVCLDAHRLLMSLKPENEKKFKDVAQFLAEDLKRFEKEGN